MKLDRFFFYLSSVAYGRVSEFVAAGERKTTKLQKIFLSLFFSSSSLEISKRISFNAKQLFFSELEKIFCFFFLMMLNMQHNEKMLMKEKQKKCLKCTSGNRHWAVEIATDFTLIKRDRQQFICNLLWLKSI